MPAPCFFAARAPEASLLRMQDRRATIWTRRRPAAGSTLSYAVVLVALALIILAAAWLLGHQLEAELGRAAPPMALDHGTVDGHVDGG
jgi:hypothetical protein